MFQNFSIFQLIKNYGHIGYPSTLTNINSLFYILGKYYNTSIIDMNKSLFLLKNHFFLLSNIILKGGFLFLVWGGLNYKEYILKSRFCHLLYKWIPGTITNFRRLKKSGFRSENFSNEKRKVKKLRFPNFVINFGFSKDILVQEGFKLPVPFLSIVDTLHSVNNFNFFIIYNTKSAYSSFFLYRVFFNFFKKMISIKKSFFLNVFKKRLSNLNGTKN